MARARNKKLTFGAGRISEATLDYAFQKLGMNNARQVVLTGGSAGGLSTFLHADYVAARVSKEAPMAFTKAMPVVGYFLDHKNFAGTAVIPELDEAHLSYAKFEDSRPNQRLP